MTTFASFLRRSLRSNSCLPSRSWSSSSHSHVSPYLRSRLLLYIIIILLSFISILYLINVFTCTEKITKPPKSCQETTLQQHVSSSPIHLIITTFPSSNSLRQYEFRETLMINLVNPYIQHVHLLAEHRHTEGEGHTLQQNSNEHTIEERRSETITSPFATSDPSGLYTYIYGLIPQHFHSKLYIIPYTHQATYAELFRYADENIPLNHIIMIANGDTHLSLASTPLLYIMSSSVVYALSRRGPPPFISWSGGNPKHYCSDPDNPNRNCINQCIEYQGSHDAFIYKQPLPRDRLNIIYHYAQHKMNTLGGENVIVSILKGLNPLDIFLNRTYVPPNPALSPTAPASVVASSFSPPQLLVVNPCNDIHLDHIHYSDNTRISTGIRIANGGDEKGRIWPNTIQHICQTSTQACHTQWRSIKEHAQQCGQEIWMRYA